ncbi:hypothetical protein H5410_000720 [Solanum commersonii]|uniref:SWIM-type domain-containing protein n=1 Tax=Solanum commersonii TaxID=4109 RepID=A0A9J6AXQ8_SOLCO|nr:hypothetical protein H5410_000720 [Solanum commersonii]
MGDRIVVPVDCNGEWVESNNRYIWHWKSKELAATIAMIVHRDIAYDDFANKIITCCKLNCELKDIVITYLHNCGEKQKTAPFKINDQLSLSTYLEDEPRGVLKIYMVERLVENHNLCDDQQVLNDECGRMNMNIPNEEREGQHILSPEVRNRLPLLVKLLIGKYPEGKGPSTKDLKNSIRIELGCKKNFMRRMKFINAPTIFVPFDRKRHCKNINWGTSYWSIKPPNTSILSPVKMKLQLDLLAKSCTCKVFDIDKVPCPHAMTALRCQYGDDYGRRIYEYSSSYYSVEVYLIAYVEEIKPVPSEETWEVPIEILERKISSIC